MSHWKAELTSRAFKVTYYEIRVTCFWFYRRANLQCSLAVGIRASLEGRSVSRSGAILAAAELSVLTGLELGAAVLERALRTVWGT